MPHRPGFTVCSLVLGIELLLVGFLMIAHGSASGRDARVPASDSWDDQAHVSQPTLSPEEQRRVLATGDWEDDYQAGREWTLRDDGTGTMVVHLDGFAAFMFGATLKFEQTWQIDHDQIVMAVTGGEPRSKIDLILKMEGSSSTQQIVELTKDRFVVVDEKGQQFEWRRVPPADEAADSASE